MRIAFICGRLERGQDGVGDYVRTLAAACAQRGHEVALLSVAEKAGVSAAEAEPWPMLRVATAQWRADGGAGAARWLERFGPNWTSLHFVPYSFDPRGFFAGSMPAIAATMATAPRRHINFHEMWIGSHQGAGWKARMTGWWQRRACAELLRTVRPARIDTSNRYYRAALATVGQAAGLLPMFGSIPLPEGQIVREQPPKVEAAALVCGMFGTIHPNWQADLFLADFARLAAELGRPAALVSTGSSGYGATWFTELGRRWSGRVTCVAAGRATEAQLARWFARFDFGITSVPWNIVGKSSAVATLCEHGLRVVVTAAGSPPRFTAPGLDEPGPGDQGLVPYFRSRERLRDALEKMPRRRRVDAVAEEFLANLNAVS